MGCIVSTKVHTSLIPADNVPIRTVTQPKSLGFQRMGAVVKKVPNSQTPVKVKNTIEKDSSKSERHPVKYYLSKSIKVFGFKYT